MLKRVILFFFALFSIYYCQKLTVFPEQLPYFQTFDSWDTCYYVGTCYEQRCDNLRGGFFNPIWESTTESADGIQRRHWWVTNFQTTSNYDNSDQPVNCPTAPLITGPCFDATKGDSTGRYIHAEASACNAVHFHLISPSIQFNNISKVMNFKYYAFGADLSTGSFVIEASDNNGTSWNNIYTRQNNAGSQQSWQTINLPLTTGIFAALEPTPISFRFAFISSGSANSGNLWRADFALDDIFISQDGAPGNGDPWIDPNCTADGTCNPLETTTTTGALQITSGDGDGLTEGEIAGIVVGIVGGAICLCCCLCLLLIILLLVISPRKPPDS